MENDKLIISQIEDKLRKCEEQYCEAHTGFLNLQEQSLAMSFVKEQLQFKSFLYGGYEEAERKIFVCIPDYISIEEAELLAVARVTNTSKGKRLTHRDYLGSLTGLGIKREKIGDILVGENGADIIILKEIGDFLLFHYDKAGRAHLEIELLPLEELSLPEIQKKILQDTVASLRLDNIVAAAFSLSRSKAAEAINRGLVFVDSFRILKTDEKICQGSKIVLRGKGKTVLTRVGSDTRKGRVRITLEKYT